MRKLTSVKSSFPLINERLVNSPASACLVSVNLFSACNIAEITATPPCTCSSQLSSPAQEIIGYVNQLLVLTWIYFPKYWKFSMRKLIQHSGKI